MFVARRRLIVPNRRAEAWLSSFSTTYRNSYSERSLCTLVPFGFLVLGLSRLDIT